MCQVFAGQNPRDYETETRSVRIGGHVTSIRLERLFWTSLEDLSLRQGMTVPRFISTLYDEVLERHGEVRNFASLLRCCCLIEGGRGGAAHRSATMAPAERRHLPV